MFHMTREKQTVSGVCKVFDLATLFTCYFGTTGLFIETKHFQNLKKNARKYTEPVFTPVFNPVPGDRVGIPGS